MEELIFGSLIVWVLGRIAKKKADQPPGTIAPPPSTPDTTPAVVPFTAANVNAYKNLNTTSIFDNRLAKQARRVTPDGTGKNIVDGSYKCFAPGSAQRIAAIKKVYEDLERLRIRIANSTGERREEARKDLREKDDERAILVAEHYVLCEKWFEDFAQRSSKRPHALSSPNTTAQQQRSMFVNHFFCYSFFTIFNCLN
jgi:hypothetical protein